MSPRTTVALETLPRRGTRRRTPKRDPDFISTLYLADEDVVQLRIETLTLSSLSPDQETMQGEFDAANSEAEVGSTAGAFHESNARDEHTVSALLKSKKRRLNDCRLELHQLGSLSGGTSKIMDKDSRICKWSLMAPSRLPPRKRRCLREKVLNSWKVSTFPVVEC